VKMEQEDLALVSGPFVVLAAARDLKMTRGRAKDVIGRHAGVRELEQLGAALRLAADLKGEDRRRVFDAVATDSTLALLVRLITDAEHAAGRDPAPIETVAALRAVLTVLFAARRAPA
jgi:hypothetical protein